VDYLRQLIRELNILRCQYSSLCDMNILKTAGGDNKLYRQRLMTAGEILINFYNNIFVPKYSGISTEIEEAGIDLFLFSKSASECLKDRTYFALGQILTNPGDKINGRNNLERLIQRLRKHAREIQKQGL
jgi:hypothetical protein